MNNINSRTKQGPQKVYKDYFKELNINGIDVLKALQTVSGFNDSNNAVDTLKDVIKFLEGFEDKDTLKEILDNTKPVDIKDYAKPNAVLPLVPLYTYNGYPISHYRVSDIGPNEFRIVFCCGHGDGSEDLHDYIVFESHNDKLKYSAIYSDRPEQDDYAPAYIRALFGELVVGEQLYEHKVQKGLMTLEMKENIDKAVNKVEKLKNDVETYIGAGKETVVVNITSSVEGVNVKNRTLYVYLNNAETPFEATTDEHGMATFRVNVGYKYRIVFPTIEGCEPIPDVTHTAGVAQRSVEVEYTDVKVMYEHLTVRLDHWTASGTKEDLSGKIVKVTVDGKTEELITNAEGTVTTRIPLGKQYRLELPKISGFYIWENKYVYILTAEMSSRYILGNYTDFESGLFIICDDGNEYTLADFKAKGIAPEDARLIKISTEALTTNSENDNGSSSVFCISIDEIRQRAFQSKVWNSANVDFTSVGYGYNYNGYKNSQLFYNEGIETGKDIPAIEHALQQEFVTSARKYNGFLGAVYQWTTLWEMREEIDEILDYCREIDENGNFFNQKTQSSMKAYDLSSFTSNKWTSCQNYTNHSYYFSSEVNHYLKSNSYLVVPFYAY